jgi:uncharacterized protein (TIGR02594 family)
MLKKFFAYLCSLFIKQQTLPVVEMPVTPTELPWIAWAKKEVGTNELDNPERIKFYHSFTKLPRNMWSPATAWCASFMSAALDQSGQESLHTAGARDYLWYGTKLDTPKFGCIVIYQRDVSKGHVHFFVKESEGLIYGLGGNQNNSVCIKAYRKDDVLGYRWPEELKKPVKPA